MQSDTDKPLSSSESDPSIPLPNSLPPAYASSEETDDQLLTAIGQSDQIAYRKLVERYLPRLWRLAMSVLGSRSEAEDAVQDVFLTLWKNRLEWRAEGAAKFSTYIYRVTMNRCIDIKRRRKITVDSDDLKDTLPASNQLPADQALSDGQDRSQLLALLENLPENQKLALIFYYFEELSISEISDKLSTTEQGTRSLLKRGRKTLKEKLEVGSNHEHHGFQGAP